MGNALALFTKMAALATMGLLTGCIPAPLGKYYRPLYPDPAVKYLGDECYGQAGAPATMTLTLADGVTLSISTARTQAEKDRPDRPLHISIGVPADTRFQFLSDEIRVSSSAQDPGRLISSDLHLSVAVVLASSETADLARMAPTHFPAAPEPLQARNFSASTWLNFSWGEQFVPAAFTMEIPPIELLDAPPKSGPPVKPITLAANAKKRPERYPGEYKAQTSLIYTTRESEALLADRYTECLGNKPAAQCQGFQIYDDAEFKVEKDGFNYTGRWYVHDVERHTPFTGEINIRYTQPVRWKFASNKVRIIDTTKGAERFYQFDHYPLNFSYQVPLDTPIRSASGVTYSKATTAGIDSSLGTEELPRYYVKLPPVLINGKRHQIQPIELEKRTLDFGLAPLNC